MFGVPPETATAAFTYKVIVSVAVAPTESVAVMVKL